MVDRMRIAAWRVGWSSIAIAVALYSGAGCTAPKAGFDCSSNDQCVSAEGSQGVCEPAGYCGFPDAACTDSGRRYGDAAPEGTSNQCVGLATGGRCVTLVAAGGKHTCAIKDADGSVWCWGGNAYGQLGDGTKKQRSTPARIKGLDGQRVVQISGGIEHACALTEAGEAYCWGSNEDGQLGVLDANDKPITGSDVPVRVDGLISPATWLSAGGNHTCVVVTGGTLQCWGENLSHQLGDGTTEERMTPVQVPGLTEVEKVANGHEHTCAVDRLLNLWCWGSNENGRTGLDATTGTTPKPTKVLGSAVDAAVGAAHTCVSKTDHSVWCWGYNSTGEVGNGGSVDVAKPSKVFSADFMVSSGSANHTCAREGVEGAVSCWGANDSGQIGNGSPDAAVSKPTAAKLVTVTALAIGGLHTCAVTQDGALWCWGSNEVEQLGPSASGASSAVPVRVPICP